MVEIQDAQGDDSPMGDADAPAAGTNGESSSLKARKEEMARVLEHVLFPAFKAKLVATKGLLRGVNEVANLKGLYRVFERC